MLRPKSRVSAVTPKIILLLLSYLFLVSAAIFGLVGSYRVDVLRTDLAKANAARNAAEHRETEFKNREAAVAGAEAKIAEAENKATKAQTELLTLQNEKAELESKLEGRRNEIAALQKRIGEAGPPASSSQDPSTASKPKQQPTTSGPSVQIAQESVEEATPPPPPRPKQPRPKQQVVPIKSQQVAGTLGTMSISSASVLAVFAPHPEYPREARSHRIAGSGVCVVSVDRGSGHVNEASIAQSTGNQTLDNSAVSTFRTWIFKPRKVSTVSISFGFTTRGTPY